MIDFGIPEEKNLNELLSLKGKTAVITGGSRGIGRQTVKRFAEAGASVVFTGRNLEALRKVEQEERAKGSEVTLCQSDVSNVEDCRKAVEFTVEKYGSIDILVNNAASFPFCDAAHMTEKIWDDCFRTDVKGTFFLSKLAAERMIDQGNGGRIINFLSTAALRPTGPLIAYGAAKQAVWYVTQTMAQELAKHKITVNAVTPGATMTKDRMEAFAGNAEKMKAFTKSSGNEGLAFAKNLKTQGMDGLPQMLMRNMPMGRVGSPDDLAMAVLYLASDMASYVTGQNITVDGAQSIQNPVAAKMSQVSEMK